MGSSKSALSNLFDHHSSKLTRLEISRLSRLKARLEFTRELRSFNLSEISSVTGESYFVLTKLAFSFSCLEALEKLLGEGRRVIVRDREFHQALSDGEFRKLTAHLDKMAMQARQKRSKDHVESITEIEQFKFNPPEDLSIYLRHCRNVVFHASITPSTLGLQGSKRRRSLILGLANSTILAVELELESWVKRVIERKVSAS